MCMVLVKNMLRLIPKVLKKYFSFNSGNKFWKISGFLLKKSSGLDQKIIWNLEFSSISGFFLKNFCGLSIWCFQNVKEFVNLVFSKYQIIC